MTYSIEQLKELVKAATPGPWYYEPRYRTINDTPGEEGDHLICGCCQTRKANSTFAAAARIAVPELIAEVETLRAALGKPITSAIHELIKCAATRDRMIVEISQENDHLRASICNQSGDNLCWLKGDEVQIPPRAEFLESCSRYHAQIAGERGELHGCLTIAQLEAEVQRLRDALEYVVNGPKIWTDAMLCAKSALETSTATPPSRIP